jgi:hypothetical protein
MRLHVAEAAEAGGLIEALAGAAGPQTAVLEERPVDAADEVFRRAL